MLPFRCFPRPRDSAPVPAPDATQFLVPSPPEVGPDAVLWHTNDGVMAAIPEHAWALATPDWRRIDVTVCGSGELTYGAAALVANAIREAAAHNGYYSLHASLVERDSAAAASL